MPKQKHAEPRRCGSEVPHRHSSRANALYAFAVRPSPSSPGRHLAPFHSPHPIWIGFMLPNLFWCRGTDRSPGEWEWNSWNILVLKMGSYIEDWELLFWTIIVIASPSMERVVSKSLRKRWNWPGLQRIQRIEKTFFFCHAKHSGWLVVNSLRCWWMNKKAFRLGNSLSRGMAAGKVYSVLKESQRTKEDSLCWVSSEK